MVIDAAKKYSDGRLTKRSQLTSFLDSGHGRPTTAKRRVTLTQGVTPERTKFRERSSGAAADQHGEQFCTLRTKAAGYDSALLLALAIQRVVEPSSWETSK